MSPGSWQSGRGREAGIHGADLTQLVLCLGLRALDSDNSRFKFQFPLQDG